MNAEDLMHEILLKRRDHFIHHRMNLDLYLSKAAYNTLVEKFKALYGYHRIDRFFGMDVYITKLPKGVYFIVEENKNDST